MIFPEYMDIVTDYRRNVLKAASDGFFARRAFAASMMSGFLP
jgi:hypothetical protein